MKQAIESILGPVQHLQPVTRGYTHNERVIATLADGRSVFVKQAVDEMTAQWLRAEHRIYEALGDRPWMATMVGWVDAERPVLVLEDLSSATWPPPWDSATVDAVLDTVVAVAQTEPPLGLCKLVDGEQPGTGWHHVVTQPAAFLALGLCSTRWLDDAGPALRDAAAAAPLAGDGLVHGDIRSDNLCVGDGRAVLIDWNFARVGNPQMDLAFWLPSLAAEHGPRPDDVMPRCPAALAAYVSGFFASQAGEPPIPHAPGVRAVQLQQLRTALPWAARVLDLPPPT